MGKTEKKLYILRGILSAIGKEYPESYIKVKDLIAVFLIMRFQAYIIPPYSLLEAFSLAI